jgi:5-formyltetrahydrofolate cyclo-ligase
VSVSTDPISEAKSSIRAEVRARLGALSEETLNAESSALCRHAMAWEPLAKASTVMAYWPIAGEADVRPLVIALLARGVTLCLPRVDWESRRLIPVPISHPERDLGPPERGVRSPRPELPPAPAGAVQTVVVPGLAFDATGARLGRGSGFYDRWLEEAGPGVRALGAALRCQLVERVPTVAHDRRMHALATPDGVVPARKPEKDPG